jgi:hypothetical protein
LAATVVRWRPIDESDPIILAQFVADQLAFDSFKALPGKPAYICLLGKLEDNGITTHFVCRVFDVPCPEEPAIRQPVALPIQAFEVLWSKSRKIILFIAPGASAACVSRATSRESPSFD